MTIDFFHSVSTEVLRIDPQDFIGEIINSSINYFNDHQRWSNKMLEEIYALS